ncbi:hypothetical protein Cgig2_004027 [Carnegiea gigantea]|uniref:Leucine-rich repeat-containing N-terminal plant-type domain-containing protein n=1 Tax=Carnegiea gigantea TaxID=171969 RepID=A0A9Q1KT67_9CARY|nr:hypothetical protein Cgig2_004027 [Carnegiea gigantea]
MLIDWIIRSLGCIRGFAVGCALGKYFTDRNHEWFVETFQRRKRGCKLVSISLFSKSMSPVVRTSLPDDERLFNIHTIPYKKLNQMYSALQNSSTLIFDLSATYPVVNSWGSEPHRRDFCLWDDVYCDEETGHVTELDFSNSCLYGTFPSKSSLFHLNHLQHKWCNPTSEGFMIEFRNYENLLLVPAGSPGKIKPVSPLGLPEQLIIVPIVIMIMAESMLIHKHRNFSSSSKKYPTVSHNFGFTSMDFRRISVGRSVHSLIHENSPVSYQQTHTSIKLTMGFQSYQYLLFSFLLVNTVFSFQPSWSCHEHEISALLQFKHSFFIGCAASLSLYAYPKVKSWGVEPHNGDCRSWDGVYCDSKTGHVIRLYGNFPSNSTIFNALTHLHHLSLSDNDFNLSRIPSELGQFSKLASLDLSNSAFSGRISSAISKLSMLSLLDLSSSEGGPRLSLEDSGLEKLVQNRTSLNQLSLDHTDIFSSVPVALTNFTVLKVVSLQFCNLNGQFPINIFHLPLLEKLYLVGNPAIAGSLPEFRQKSPLRKLDLSTTSFQGQVPFSIGQLANLEELMLYSCDLSEVRTSPVFSREPHKAQFLGPSQQNCFQCFSSLDKLTALSVNFINLGAEIPSVIANITSLTLLDLAQNLITGRIPHWLVNLTQLNVLSLSNNQLQGPILPSGISQFPNLCTLLLGGNHNLNGNFDGFLKLKNLVDLHLSGVTLTFGGENATNESVSKLIALDLSSCNFSQFPRFLNTPDEL